ncbi:MAG: hypothetical protein FWH41_09940 [Treponema sp.]|nr:hypothetical protein [Treponema sp.]
MGFLDDLKKTTVGKIVNSVEKAIETASGTSTRPNTNYESSSRSSAVPQSSKEAAINNNSTSTNVDQKFDQILAAEFSGVEVIKNAAPESVGISAPQPCRPYSYALLRNGKIVAAIMLTPHNRDRNSAYLNAKKSALDSNIQFLNFYTHYMNERNYVISRIRNAL